MSRAGRWVTGAAAFAFASALTLGTPASAQPPAGGGAGVAADATSGLNVDVATLVKAKAGAWAEYSMSGGQRGAMTMRYAVVERTPQKLTLEVTTKTARGDMLMHLEFVPAGGDAWKVMVGRMTLGAQKIDIPVDKLAAAPPIRPSDSVGTLVGPEKLTTPAGAYACKHYTRTLPMPPPQPGQPPLAKAPTLNLWMNEGVSPTGLVKYTLDAIGVEMTLSATGTDAKPQPQ
jgi:hypothetical protein